MMDGKISEVVRKAELKIPIKILLRLLPITIIEIIGMKTSLMSNNSRKFTNGFRKISSIKIEVNSTNKVEALEICLKLDQWFSDTDFPRYLFIPTWISIFEIFAKSVENVIMNPIIPIILALV